MCALAFVSAVSLAADRAEVSIAAVPSQASRATLTKAHSATSLLGFSKRIASWLNGSGRATVTSRRRHRHRGIHYLAKSLTTGRGKGHGKGKPEPEPEPTPEPTSGSTSEPEPTPESTEPTPEPEPSGELLFNGSHISDFALLQEAPGAITEVPDPLGSGRTVFKFTVNNSDVYPITPTENPRAQALSPSFIEPGDEFWVHTEVMLPLDFPDVPKWLCLTEIYGPPFAGSSPFHICIRNNDELLWPRNGTYNNDVPWAMKEPKGRWISILWHERFGTDGYIELWIDRNQITFFNGGEGTYNPNHIAPTMHLAMQTMDSSNNGGANRAKIMQYRKVDMFETATNYFGPLKVGTTRASVGG